MLGTHFYVEGDAPLFDELAGHVHHSGLSAAQARYLGAFLTEAEDQRGVCQRLARLLPSVAPTFVLLRAHPVRFDLARSILRLVLEARASLRASGSWAAAPAISGEQLGARSGGSSDG